MRPSYRRHLRGIPRSLRQRSSHRVGLACACVALIATLSIAPASASVTPTSANRRATKRVKKTKAKKKEQLTKAQRKQIVALIKKYAGTGPQGPEGAQGPGGSQGPPGKDGTNAIAGPPTGPAGGDLTGTYPNPQLAAGTVGTANFAPGAVAPGAELLGGFLPAAFQKRVTGECASGEAVRKIDAAGAVTCQATGTGTVTSVGSGTGLTGGPITSSGSLSLASGYQLPQSCANGEIAKSNGSNSWSCASEEGTITEITTSGGLSGGGSSGSVDIGVNASQIQSRVTGTCSSGEAIRSVAQNGGVSCGTTTPSGSAGGALTGTYPNPELDVSGGPCANGEAVTDVSGEAALTCGPGVYNDGENVGVNNSFPEVTSGTENNAFGFGALSATTEGCCNTAMGTYGLLRNTTGAGNAAFGEQALWENTSGSYNTAVGSLAGFLLTTGTKNTMIGHTAGFGLTSGDNNLYIDNPAIVGNESNTIRIGMPFDDSIHGNPKHTRAFLAGVSGVSPGGSKSPVVINSEGQLGTSSSPLGTITEIKTSGGLSGGGSSGSVEIGVEASQIQSRVTGTCSSGEAVQSVAQNGGVSCGTTTPSGSAGGALTGDYPSPELDVSGGPCANGEAVTDVSGEAALTCGQGVYSDAKKNTAVGAEALVTNTTGEGNSALGQKALSSNTEGNLNSAVGKDAMGSNTTGWQNTAVGQNALGANTEGWQNTALGLGALASNTTATENTALGTNALHDNTGNYNSALGTGALEKNVTGDNNVALGYHAGQNITGENNIDIGAGVQGLAGESNTIRIGSSQTKAFLAGVSGRTTGEPASAVVVDSNGQLGTTSSSRRFKRDIHPLGRLLDGLMRLRPVSFRYKRSYVDGPSALQFGLIAEQVADVYPNLVVHGRDGRPSAVAYQELPTLLLAQVQRQQAQIGRQRRQIRALRAKTRSIGRLHAQVRWLMRHARTR